MATWGITIIAVVSTAICIFLWFKDVRRVMRERMSTVESAAAQLAVSRDKACCNPDAPDMGAVLERSKSIYSQAVKIYEESLQKPWNYIPARIMGYEHII